MLMGDGNLATEEPVCRLILTAIPEGMLLVDENGSVAFANPAAEQLLGYAPDELIDSPIDRIYPEGSALELGFGPHQIEPIDRIPIECSLAHSDGYEVPVTLDVTETEYDRQRCHVVSFHDRSEAESERRYEAIANAVDDGIYQLDSEGRFVAVNDQIVEVTGYSRDRLFESHVSLLLDDATIDRITRRISDLIRTGEESATLELDVRTATDDIIPCELRLRVLLTNGEFAGTVGVVRDISERVEREQEVSRRSAMIESAMDGMAFADETGEFRYVNPALAALHRYDNPTDLVGATWHVLFPDDEAKRMEREVLPVVQDSGSWRGEAVGMRADGSRFPQDHSLTALDDGIVCLTRDITDRKARERQLEALNDATRAMMSAETHDDIAQIGVESVEHEIDFEIACVRLLDHDTNRLEYVALTDGAQELLETQTACDLDATLAGRALRSEETLVNAIPGDEPSEYTSCFENSSIHVPIGSDGVLSILVGSDETVGDTDIHLAEMVAIDIEAAHARADRTRRLRTNEQELRQQHQQLETLTRINAVNIEINSGLIAATTREELDRTICERLVESDLYRSAWIGLVDRTRDRIGRTVSAGVEANYLDAVPERSLSGIAGGIVEQAIETKEMQILRQYQIASTDETTENDPNEDIEAIAAVPLVYGDRAVGALVINSVRDDVFCENAIAGFESLGELIGFAKNALKSRELLLSDAIVELEFTLSDPTVFYTQVTKEADCRGEFERAVPIENGRIITYDTIYGADPAAVLEVAENADHIESARVISERDDGFVLQSVTSHSMVQFSLELGTSVQSAVAEAGKGTVIIEAPQSANIREIVTAFEHEFSGLKLVAKRKRERSVMTAQEFRESVADRLTKKQHNALEMAYLTGYYDWPRKTTAEEFAETMGISSSTLHQHLRKGGWSLLSAFFDDSLQSPRSG